MLKRDGRLLTCEGFPWSRSDWQSPRNK
jgi:hypothetical protein